MTSTTFSDSHPSPSPTAFSPFSTPHSLATDFATSDESPDLGAFRNVFRTFQEFQPRWPAHLAPSAPGLGLGTSTPPTTDHDGRGFTPTDLESSLDVDGVELHSTVWAQQPVARYLEASPPPGSATPSSSHSLSASSPRPRSALVTHDLPTHDVPRPTLGGLDAAFEFLANERARLAAQRASLRRLDLPMPITFESSLEPESSSPITPGRGHQRRKRRASMHGRPGVHGHDAEDSYDDPISPVQSSLPDTAATGLHATKTKPKSSPLAAKDKGKSRALALNPERLPSGSAADYAHRLLRARSTPILRTPAPQLQLQLQLQARALDPQRLRLRALAIKLKFWFSDEVGRLANVLRAPSMGVEAGVGSGDGAGAGRGERVIGEDFADVRGPSPIPHSGEPITHVFVDYSNILIGYLSYLRAHRLDSAHMSHAALALVLERGRPITRRILVASSPLYQPMDPAQQLGYEVYVYARVPDTGDGADRVRRNGVNGTESPRKSGAVGGECPRKAGAGAVDSPRKGEGERGRKNGHRRGVSVRSGVIQESDSSASASQQHQPKPQPIPGPSSSHPPAPASGTSSPSNGRIRYHEQGVDELLQLKLHQVIAAQGNVPPPAGSTIVLATGDGNAGQFNEDGFRGCVRLALRRQWKVELHAWEDGTSRSWVREFGREAGFSIEKLDRFATDLRRTLDIARHA